MARAEPAVLWFMGPLALLVVAATIVCGILGFVLARHSDDEQDAANRQALRNAVESLQRVSPDLSRVDPDLIRILERASGLKDLRFDADPPATGREVQSLIDARGRIVGWFSWEQQRRATATMYRLLPLAAIIAVGLFGFAIIASWQLRRLGTQLAKSTREVRKLAFKDAITGLPNLHSLREFLDRSLALRKPEEGLAFALVDLGGLDDTKDAVGEAGEDEVLISIANRLREAVPERVLIARLRGDKFGLVMPSTDEAMAVEVAEAVRDAISRAMWVNQVVQVSANVGIAMAPRDGVVREEITRRADLALRVARRRGRGMVISFSPEMETDFDDRRFIKRELARALVSRAFEVHYQPIVKADGGAIVGVEALLRWNHPSRGFIAPNVFVRVAEEAGLMDQLGEFVLRRALSDASRWPQLYVAVNLSPVQVRDRRFVDLVSAVLAETKTDPARVVLEVTEGILIDDPLTAKARLEDLRALGVRLALDDFGSGYSSLGYLQQLPFDKLKIDRGFVAALDRSANTGVIIQAIVALGRALGMSVLIEGVETEEQRVLLRLAGCNEMQGYLFARPAPLEEVDRLLGQQAAAPQLPVERSA
ncbi:MAG: putative bifunctional diguanylate cyclase/phosphodiesterase [Xanthobacteraceae bacterium]